MKEYTQKEIAGAMDFNYHLIDILDDGYHNSEIADLIKINNGLYSKLTPNNQKKYVSWLNAKIEARNAL